MCVLGVAMSVCMNGPKQKKTAAKDLGKFSTNSEVYTLGIKTALVETSK